jgi:galactokinase
VVAAARDDDIVNVRDARESRVVTLDAGDLTAQASGWAKYPAAVVRRLRANFPGARLGADIVFSSDLPRAAGMSSSSALVVGIALALVERGDLTARPEWRSCISDLLDLSGYLGAIENGRGFRTLIGLDGVGTQGGSQDHTAILACLGGFVSAFRYAPGQRLLDVPMPDDWQFVLMTSGVHASKAGSVRERYNRAPQAIAALMELWGRDTGEAPSSFAALLASRPGAIDHLRRLMTRGAMPGFTPDDLERRLAHFVAEDARVPLAAHAFRDRDERLIGELSADSQHAAEWELGNQVAETVQLAKAARTAGAMAASSFGAGFGGSVWALVRGDAAEARQCARRWHDIYTAACPHTRGVEWLATRPGPPAIALLGRDPRTFVSRKP